MVSHFGGFTDHYAHAMVDEDTVADAGAGVNLDAGQATAQLAQQAGWQFQGEAGPPQAVTEAVRRDGLKPWVAEQDFQGTPGGWIPFTDNGQVGSDLFEHGSAGTARLPG